MALRNGVSMGICIPPVQDNDIMHQSQVNSAERGMITLSQAKQSLSKPLNWKVMLIGIGSSSYAEVRQ
jgi:hypothetical protein